MSDVMAWVGLGFRHIASAAALDHILFLLALAAIYRLNDWRESLLVVTAFTAGHSVTLILAVTGTLRLSTPLIEFLIPITILVTSAENLSAYRHAISDWRRRIRPILAGAFGLVHGAGFANYLKSLFVEDIALPLLGFNLGIEVGQVVVLAGAGIAFAAVDRALGADRLRPVIRVPLHARAAAVSAFVALFAVRMILERAPW